MKTVLIESQYLPPIAFFSILSGFEEVRLERFEFYEKQTYRNRCYIRTAHGTGILIIPLTSKHGKTPICDVKIDYSQKWLNNHWRTIQTAYGNAPFFEYYADDLHGVLFKKFEFLYDLNFNLLTMCFKWLKWDLPLKETLAYEKEPAPPVVDMRSILNPKKEDSCNRFCETVIYRQVFGSKFVPNLSIIDLVFCEGPGAMSIIKASAQKSAK